MHYVHKTADIPATVHVAEIKTFKKKSDFTRWCVTVFINHVGGEGGGTFERLLRESSTLFSMLLGLSS